MIYSITKLFTVRSTHCRKTRKTLDKNWANQPDDYGRTYYPPHSNSTVHKNEPGSSAPAQGKSGFRIHPSGHYFYRIRFRSKFNLIERHAIEMQSQHRIHPITLRTRFHVPSSNRCFKDRTVLLTPVLQVAYTFYSNTPESPALPSIAPFAARLRYFEKKKT